MIPVQGAHDHTLRTGVAALLLTLWNAEAMYFGAILVGSKEG